MNNNGKMLTALGLGIAAGTILGILIAPDKGTETRKKIAEGGKKIADTVKDGINKGKETLSEFRDDIKEVIREKKQAFS